MSLALPSIPYVSAHGARIPQVGLGTMTLVGEAAVKAIAIALEVGYRHIDTAAYYGNEKEVGEALRASGIPREDVFVTTKVRPAEAMPEDFARVVAQSLANLRTPYVDLLLIHWPSKVVPLHLTVGALCKVKKEGRAKHIGVANFTTSLLEEALSVTTEPLVCNQIECHPFINQDKVIAACDRRDMAVVAYVPLARGEVSGAETLQRIGTTRGKSAAQVSMRYLIQRGMVPIPRSANRRHLLENLDIFDFRLTDVEMAEIKVLDGINRRLVNPLVAPVWDTP